MSRKAKQKKQHLSRNYAQLWFEKPCLRAAALPTGGFAEVYEARGARQPAGTSLQYRGQALQCCWSSGAWLPDCTPGWKPLRR